MILNKTFIKNYNSELFKDINNFENYFLKLLKEFQMKTTCPENDFFSAVAHSRLERLWHEGE